MTKQLIGWLFVAFQLVLLVAVVILPGNDIWPTSGLTSHVGWAVSIIGAAVVVLASLGLGSALTPTPVPKQEGELTTTGLYGFVRHPIYSGVIAIVAGIVIRSGSIGSALVGGIAIAFFSTKARWEEQQLAQHYPDYPAYAARTPRFVPMPWRRHHR